MIIRQATADDIDGLIQLRIDYLAAQFKDISETIEQICAQLKDYFEEHLSRDFFAFLAKENGRTIGCLFLVVQEKPANPRFPGGRTGLLLNVFTYPAYRRRGVAGSLLSTAIEEAKKIGLSYIELTATEAGVPLYEKFGFEKKEADKEMILVFNTRLSQ